jgi:death-on-curing protein
MKEPVWILQEAVIAIHKRQLAEHGGGTGIRDLGLLESAILKPRHVFLYGGGDTSIPQLASAYAFGIARNHPFVDGNKRTALVLSLLFLRLNDWQLNCSPDDLYETFMKLAEGSLSEENLCSWFVEHTNPTL